MKPGKLIPGQTDQPRANVAHRGTHACEIPQGDGFQRQVSHRETADRRSRVRHTRRENGPRGDEVATQFLDDPQLGPNGLEIRERLTRAHLALAWRGSC